MVPASMFIYGSILIAVTFNPVVFKRRPVLEASPNQPLLLAGRGGTHQ
jgi:hypothetical protein